MKCIEALSEKEAEERKDVRWSFYVFPTPN